MSRTSINQSDQADQRGIVSIMVTLIMMIVITLIVLGFGQLARRNQRESLDRQLSVQAYYAAETGINDAVAILRHPTYTSNLPSDSTQCNNFTTSNTVTSQLGNGDNVEFTCVLVNSHPTDHLVSVIPTGQESAFPVTFDSPVQNMVFSWDAADKSNATVKNANNCSSGKGVFPTAANWGCGYGLLQVDITNTTTLATPYTAASLAANTVTVYLQPRSAGDAAPAVVFADPTKQTMLVGATCTTATGNCIAGIALNGGTDFKIRMSSIYRDAKSVVMVGQSAGVSIPQTGAQVVIDSTGRSQDELRRIQERVNINQLNSAVVGGDPSPNALSVANGICKRFTVPTSPGTTTCNVP